MRVNAGSAGGRALKTRQGLETRPTAALVKGALFNMQGARVVGSRFLDVFAGNGGVGIEALSRGASLCIFIEKNGQCVKIIKENLALTGLMAYGRVIPREAKFALAELEEEGETFDIIFLDPPYFSSALAPVLRQLVSANLLAVQGIIVVEHHRLDTDWRDVEWTVLKEKQYGDTMLTFLVPAGVEKR